MLFDPGKPLPNLADSRSMRVGHWEPQIMHLCPPEAGEVVGALGTQVDDCPHPQPSQPCEIIEHQGPTEEYLLIDDIPPVERQDQSPEGASQEQKGKLHIP
jgi:hypothetical protein